MRKNPHRNYCNYQIDKCLNTRYLTVKNAETATKVKRTNYTPFEIQKLLLDF